MSVYPAWSGVTCLVTGGLGFIGSNLVATLVASASGAESTSTTHTGVIEVGSSSSANDEISATFIYEAADVSSI